MSPDCLLGVVPQPTDSRLSETIRDAARKLINNFIDRQGVGIAPKHLLNCFQCSVMKVRSYLNNSDSSNCSVCCPHSQCLSVNLSSVSNSIAIS